MIVRTGRRLGLLMLLAALAAGVWGPQTVFGCSPGDVTDVYLWVGDTQGDAESYNTADVWKCPGEIFGWYIEWDADTPDIADFDGEIWVGSTRVRTFGADEDDRDKALAATVPGYFSGGIYSVECWLQRDGGEWEVSNTRTLKVVEVELQCLGHSAGFDDLDDDKVCTNAQSEYGETKFEVTKIEPSGEANVSASGVSLTPIGGASLGNLNVGDQFWAVASGSTGDKTITLEHNDDTSGNCQYEEDVTVFKFVVKTSDADTSPGAAGGGSYGNYWVHQQAGSSNVKCAADLEIRRFAWIETEPSGEYSNYVKAKLKVSESWGDNFLGWGLYIYNDDLRVNEITVGLSFGLIVRLGVPYPYEEMSLFKGEVRIKGPTDANWAVSPTGQAELKTSNLWPWECDGTVSIATPANKTTWINCFKVGDSTSRAEARSRASVSGSYRGPGDDHITIGHAEFEKVVEVEEDTSFDFEITGSSCSP